MRYSLLHLCFFVIGLRQQKMQKVSNRIVLSFRSTSNKDRVPNLCVSSKVLIICGGQWSLRSHKCRTYFPHFSPLEAVLTHGSKLSTTNWIERLNRSYKRTLHMRAAMPSPESALLLLESVALQMTTETYSHRLYQFDDWYIK